MSRRTLEFWYEFASTYSYLSAMRIESLAAEAEITVRWRPFLLQAHPGTGVQLPWSLPRNTRGSARSYPPPWSR